MKLKWEQDRDFKQDFTCRSQLLTFFIETFEGKSTLKTFLMQKKGGSAITLSKEFDNVTEAKPNTKGDSYFRILTAIEEVDYKLTITDKVEEEVAQK